MARRCLSALAFLLFPAAFVCINPVLVLADEIIYAQDGRQIVLKQDGTYQVLMDPRYYGMTAPQGYSPAYPAPPGYSPGTYVAPPVYPYGYQTIPPAAPAIVPPAPPTPAAAVVEAPPKEKKSMLDKIFEGEPAKRTLRSK